MHPTPLGGLPDRGGFILEFNGHSVITNHYVTIEIWSFGVHGETERCIEGEEPTFYAGQLGDLIDIDGLTGAKRICSGRALRPIAANRSATATKRLSTGPDRAADTDSSLVGLVPSRRSCVCTIPNGPAIPIRTL